MSTRQAGTKQATPDQLRADAARLAVESAEASAKVQQHEAAEAARSTERQAADRRLVDTWRRAAYDDDVEQARRALHQAVQDDPLTQALGRYLHAQVRRYAVAQEMLGARARLALPTAGAQLPPVADVLTIGDYVARAAIAIADEMTGADHQNAANAPNETETRR